MPEVIPAPSVSARPPVSSPHAALLNKGNFRSETRGVLNLAELGQPNWVETSPELVESVQFQSMSARTWPKAIDVDLDLADSGLDFVETTLNFAEHNRSFWQPIAEYRRSFWQHINLTRSWSPPKSILSLAELGRHRPIWCGSLARPPHCRCHTQGRRRALTPHPAWVSWAPGDSPVRGRSGGSAWGRLGIWGRCWGPIRHF